MAFSIAWMRGHSLGEDITQPAHDERSDIVDAQPVRESQDHFPSTDTLTTWHNRPIHFPATGAF